MHEKAMETLKEARVALQDRDYEQAASLAEQARVSASSARAVVEARDTETQTREEQENARANALDAVAKARRNIAKIEDPEIMELAEEAHTKAKETLEQADQALQDEDFTTAYILGQKSVAYSTAALAMAEAKTADRKKLEEIENSIMQEAAGIPESSVRKTKDGIVISMGGDLFAQGGSQIRNEAKARLKTLAELLKKYPDYRVIIEGHTDSIGSDDSNLKISTERAANFLKYMVDNENIPLERLSSIGYGETRPIASNINEAGRRQNRRVDVVILTAPTLP
jgi:outer membrane protein OmpA-like peptidoglycan-associated protein